MNIRTGMKEAREQIETSDGEAESNSISVLVYENEHNTLRVS
jgi:hypothetical protein